MTQPNRQTKCVRISVVIFSLSLFIFGCVSKPSKIQIIDSIPQSKAQLIEIIAKSPDELELVFELTTENTDTGPYLLKELEAVLQLDGVSSGTHVLKPALLIAARSTATQKFSVPVDLKDHPDHMADDLQYELAVRLDFLSNDGSERTSTVSLEGSFSHVQKPLFRISSIKIYREELINTSMKVGLEIENPNGFPLELSALTYELFGEDRYWADGTQADSFQIPARTKVIVNSQISMNFIDMKRSLLDQFINMQDVGYRFKGTVRVLTGIPYLSEFSMNFDEQGRTQVIE